MMKNTYIHSIFSAALSIIPMVLIVVLLSVIRVEGVNPIVSLSVNDYVALAIGAIVMIVGLGLFQVGAANGLAKVGEYMGSSLSKQSKLFVVIIFSFLLGTLITCAEPSILIVATQVNIPAYLLIGSIAAGVGIFVVIGVIRIIFHGQLKLWYLLYYFIVFALICLIAVDDETRQFLPFIFDAGGITTGSATVPFILALGVGIATVRGGHKSTSDSFGLVGMASIGPIISMTMLLMLNRSGFSAYVITITEGFGDVGSVFNEMWRSLMPSSASNLGTIVEVLMALIPIIVIFVIYDLIFIKLPASKIKELVIGFGVSFIGLVIFLTGVSAIMSPFGSMVGEAVGQLSSNSSIILIAFIIGLVTILCEPAVHVLTEQISSVSDGQIKKSTVLISLSIGVGIAIGLSAIRTLFNFSILYIVVPGYALSIVLMFACPDTYTAMAFDAGGTASGPMSVSFVLPMIIGITHARNPDLGTVSVEYYTRSFGVVALIALTPIITIQLLGVYHKFKNIMRLRIMSGSVDDPNDAQIIHFN